MNKYISDLRIITVDIYHVKCSDVYKVIFLEKMFHSSVHSEKRYKSLSV